MATQEEELHDEIQLVHTNFTHSDDRESHIETTLALLDIVRQLNSRVGELEAQMQGIASAIQSTMGKTGYEN